MQLGFEASALFALCFLADFGHLLSCLPNHGLQRWFATAWRISQSSCEVRFISPPTLSFSFTISLQRFAKVKQFLWSFPFFFLFSWTTTTTIAMSAWFPRQECTFHPQLIASTPQRRAASPHVRNFEATVMRMKQAQKQHQRRLKEQNRIPAGHFDSLGLFLVDFFEFFF